MIKNNVKIKEDITFEDQLNAIEYITSSNFSINEGEIEFTPEYTMSSELEAIALYFMQGIEFEDDDIMYECIMKDKEVLSLTQKFFYDEDEKVNKKNGKYISIYNFVMNNVQKKVDFMLQKLIHTNPVMNEFSTLLSSIFHIISNFRFDNLLKLKDVDIKTAMEFMKKISDSKVDITSDSIAEIFKTVIKIDDKTAEIIDSKNAEIKELKKYKMLWDSRNVNQGK